MQQANVGLLLLEFEDSATSPTGTHSLRGIPVVTRLLTIFLLPSNELDHFKGIHLRYILDGCMVIRQAVLTQ